MDTPWPERIDAETRNAIYDRAKGKCQCNSASCAHPAGLCPHPGDEVAIPTGTKKEEYAARGQLMCDDCF